MAETSIPQGATVFYIKDKSVDVSQLSDFVVQGDNNAKVIYFTLPRMQDGLDLSEYNFKITGINANNQPAYQAAEKIIDPTKPEIVAFKWVISDNFTIVDGIIDLTITATDPNGKTKWNTKKASFKVNTGINVSEYTDISEQILEIMQELANSAATSADRSETSAAQASLRDRKSVV